MFCLERILGGGLRLGVLRGVFFDDAGEEVGALWDEIDFRPDGTFAVHYDVLHGEETANFVAENNHEEEKERGK